LAEPVFFLEHPKATGRPDASGGLRRFQHLYAYPVYGITFWVWRVASVADVVRRRDAREAALLAANAAATLALVPWPVAAAGVTIGGFLVGALVSATHQSEEIVAERRDDFVLAQFASTRDADASASPLLAWLWGGMDTQLEHHLFPSMPRYKYAALRPRLQAWAAEHNIEYRISDWKDILRDNYATLRAAAAAEPAARSSA
jgi:fatty acid desaturase